METEKPEFKLTLRHKVLIAGLTSAFMELHVGYLQTNDKDDSISNSDVLEFNKTEKVPLQVNPFRRGEFWNPNLVLKLLEALRKAR